MKKNTGIAHVHAIAEVGADDLAAIDGGLKAGEVPPNPVLSGEKPVEVYVGDVPADDAQDA
jgi:hypothetical protein